jgi:peptidoglycan/LPS O-acetylase OafA/YrhL
MADIGVVFFFIISGLLISNSILSKLGSNGFNFKEYFIDRFARIYSGLIPSLIVIWALDSFHIARFPDHYLSYNLLTGEGFTFISEFTKTNFFACLMMLQHIPVPALDVGYGFGTGRPLWTLAIEWWLYLSFGWALIAYNSVGNGTKKAILLALFSFLPLSNFLFKSHGSLILVWYFGVLIRVLLSSESFVSTIHRVRFRHCICLVLLLLALMRIAKMGSAHDLSADVLIVLAFVFTLPVMSQSTTFTSKARSLIKFFSGYSYTLYLVHMPIVTLLSAVISDVITLVFASFVGANVVSAAIAYPTEMKHKLLAKWMKNRLYSHAYCASQP